MPHSILPYGEPPPQKASRSKIGNVKAVVRQYYLWATNNKLTERAGQVLIDAGRWLSYRGARKRKKGGRKPFRRFNLDKASRIREKFQPVERFEPNLSSIVIPKNFQPHHGRDQGGLWQFEIMKTLGLEPKHSLLDVGCGDLRAGVPLIRYLSLGSYVGLDQSEVSILQGCISLTEEDWKKKPEFYVGGDFSLERIGRTFDFLLANSVFTHLDLSMVGKGLASAFDVLVPGGRFIATVFAAPHERPWTETPLYRPEGKIDAKFTYSYRNPYHHSLKLIAQIAEDIEFALEVVESKHPKKQTVLQFTKPSG